jgi:hypothetical protein
MKELQMIFMWRSPHHKADSSLSEILFDIPKTLIQKVVVSKVGIRKVVDAREEHHHWKPKFVRHMHCHVQSMIVDPAFCPLHPVNNGFPASRGSSIFPHSHSRVLSKPRQFLTYVILVVQDTTPSSCL